ncbi:hypothetical protein ACFE04_001295 [Oxalis oulophora]
MATSNINNHKNNNNNDWLNSYLEAILDVGPTRLDDVKSSSSSSSSSLLLSDQGGRFSPSRYFIEQVITGFDETDIYRSWVKASSTRSPMKERNTRLENVCWRIWNLARQKKQFEGELAQRTAKRRQEREQGRRQAVADLSEDLSDGDKGDLASESNRSGRLATINSVDAMETFINQHKAKKLYIVLIRHEL